MKKGIKKLIIVGSSLFLTAGFISFGTLFSIGKNNLSNSALANSGKGDEIASSSKAASTFNPLVPLATYWNNPFLSAKTGPIVQYNNKVTALDWYGKAIWTFDSTKYLPPGVTTSNMSPWFGSAIANWDLDYNNSKLYILTNSSGNKSQHLIRIDVITGNVEMNHALAYKPWNYYGYYFQLKVLASNKVMAYSQGNGSWALFDLYDIATNTFSNHNSSQTQSMGNVIPNISQVRINFLFSIAPNLNIAVLTNFGSYGDGSSWFALVNDNMERAVTDTSSRWYNAVKMVANEWDQEDYRTGYNFLRNSYTFQSGLKTFFTVKNKIFLIGNAYDAVKKDLPIKTIDLGNFKTNQLDSFTVDTNENIFFKYINDTKINKITFSGTDALSTTYTISTYYDLAGSPIPNIVSGASRFKLYNVFGYSGQIMLLESYQRTALGTAAPDPSTLGYECGLAVGIVNNVSDPSQGDTRGLLNTDKAFQFSPDFTINQNVLDSKLPSEILKTDITILNEAFFTGNTTTIIGGGLQYPPFMKTNVNDQAGTFSITVNLDQIPWFTTTLPSGYIPTTITKTFTTKQNINSRFSWKDVSLDYNLLNTLPSKVTLEEVNKFDPFVINLNSQTVTDPTTGTLIYPKKTYSITNTNDATGSITIGVRYQYYPQSVQLIESNLLTFNTSNTYTIFKSTSARNFTWIGGNNTTTDISTIPSLKYLSSSNYLPSSIKSTDYVGLLSFIDQTNTKGYPLNKMTFSLAPNDANGTLTITGTMPASYSGTLETFTKTYTGFNKKVNYSFVYQLPNGLSNLSSEIVTKPITTKNNYTKILPSKVTILNIYEDFVKYTGYNSLDLKLTLNPNDVAGTLGLTFELINNYPSILETSNSFKLIGGKYISQIELGGFFTNRQFLSEYSLTFKDNNDTSLKEIKMLDPQTIKSKVSSPEGLVVSGVTYHSEKDLASLFISGMGAKLPLLSSADVSMITSSQNGTIIFQITYKNLFDYPLIFTREFSGFVQGVAVPTNDSFIFYSQSTLEQGLFKNKPSVIRDQFLLNKTLEIKKFISYMSGQFPSLISNPNNFSLDIDANDIYGTLNISITFSNVTNPKTLKTYSVQYVGFSKI